MVVYSPELELRCPRMGEVSNESANRRGPDFESGDPRDRYVAPGSPAEQPPAYGSPQQASGPYHAGPYQETGDPRHRYAAPAQQPDPYAAYPQASEPYRPGPASYYNDNQPSLYGPYEPKRRPKSGARAVVLGVFVAIMLVNFFFQAGGRGPFSLGMIPILALLIVMTSFFAFFSNRRG